MQAQRDCINCLDAENPSQDSRIYGVRWALDLLQGKVKNLLHGGCGTAPWVFLKSSVPFHPSPSILPTPFTTHPITVIPAVGRKAVMTAATLVVSMLVMMSGK